MQPFCGHYTELQTRVQSIGCATFSLESPGGGVWTRLFPLCLFLQALQKESGLLCDNSLSGLGQFRKESQCRCVTPDLGRPSSLGKLNMHFLQLERHIGLTPEKPLAAPESSSGPVCYTMMLSKVLSSGSLFLFPRNGQVGISIQEYRSL